MVLCTYMLVSHLHVPFSFSHSHSPFPFSILISSFSILIPILHSHFLIPILHSHSVALLRREGPGSIPLVSSLLREPTTSWQTLKLTRGTPLTHTTQTHLHSLRLAFSDSPLAHSHPSYSRPSFLILQGVVWDHSTSAELARTEGEELGYTGGGPKKSHHDHWSGAHWLCHCHWPREDVSTEQKAE